jgi:hypothetical protein
MLKSITELAQVAKPRPVVELRYESRVHKFISTITLGFLGMIFATPPIIQETIVECFLSCLSGLLLYSFYKVCGGLRCSCFINIFAFIALQLQPTLVGATSNRLGGVSGI